jgi:hypothetical protein
MRAIREWQKFYTITGDGVGPRTIEKGKWRYVTTMIVFAGHFDSNARVALDLLARRPLSECRKRSRQFEPPRGYISQLRYDSVAFVAGFTLNLLLKRSSAGSLSRDSRGAKDCTNELAVCAEIVCILSRSQKLELLKELLRKANRLDFAKTEFQFVDGFARDNI